MTNGRKFINWLRSVTPDWIRWHIGPVIAYLVYVVRVYVLGNPGAPRVLSVTETLDLIIKDKLSVIRFGDGEMSLLGNNDLGFQRADPELSRRLKEIIRVNEKGLLICLPGLFGRLQGFLKMPFQFALHHMFRYRHDWLQLLSPNQVYGDTFITRPYLAYKPEVRKHSGEVFKKLFSIWQGERVVLIEGAKSRLGVGNDMFKQTASLERILCPPENAFAKYNQILQEALKSSKDKLILVSLGPAAKVLAYDLFRAGYRVLDVGHIDMEYEMFLRQEPIQAKVKYKYFNEIQERNPEDCTDPGYLRQIIANIP